MMRALTLMAVLVAAAPWSACGEDEQSAAGDGAAGARVAIAVAPLGLEQVGEAIWTLTVENGDSPRQRVWSATVSSSQYGDGAGSLAYVAPCDASPGVEDNLVTVELVELRDSGGGVIDESDYFDPTPVSLEVDCEESRDTPVTFNLVIARSAEQGFFDVAVSLDDIFCSAKLDCIGDDGPLELLFDGEDPATTIVVAWACTGGEGTATYLHSNAFVFACSDGTIAYHDPSRGPGNVGGVLPYLFQRGVYTGREAHETIDKCYWNSAFGLDLEAIPSGVDCTLSGRATASSSSWDDGHSPAGWVWPVIDWSVQVVEDGALSCQRHPLNEPDSGVATDYTEIEGERFDYTLACEPDTPIAGHGVRCESTVSGIREPVRFAESPAGVVVSVGGESTDPLPLPEGVHLVGCCPGSEP